MGIKSKGIDIDIDGAFNKVRYVMKYNACDIVNLIRQCKDWDSDNGYVVDSVDSLLKEAQQHAIFVAQEEAKGYLIQDEDKAYEILKLILDYEKPSYEDGIKKMKDECILHKESFIMLIKGSKDLREVYGSSLCNHIGESEEREFCETICRIFEYMSTVINIVKK